MAIVLKKLKNKKITIKLFVKVLLYLVKKITRKLKYELCHELPNDLRPRILGNSKNLKGNPHVSADIECPVSPQELKSQFYLVL